MSEERHACIFIKHAQCRHLRACESTEEQNASGQQRATQRGREKAQRLLQDVRDHEVKPGAAMIGGRATEVDLNRMSVQLRVRLGASQCDGIDVRCHDEAGTAFSCDSGKHPCTGSYVQHCFRLPLPA